MTLMQVKAMSMLYRLRKEVRRITCFLQHSLQLLEASNFLVYNMKEHGAQIRLAGEEVKEETIEHS